jgi:hypothetical protein
MTLRDELINDPLGRGYSTMTETEVVADLNAMTRPMPVPDREVKLALMRQGSWATILKAQSDVTHPGRDVALLVVALLDDWDRGDLDFNDADVQYQMGAMVATGLVTQAQADAVVAMQENRQSRAQELNLGRVQPGDVERGRM